MSGFFAWTTAPGAALDGDLFLRMSEGLGASLGGDVTTHTDRRAGLAHARVPAYASDESVRQPLSLDGEVWIVADARIDAVVELIARLRTAGQDVPVGASSAELLLHSYAAWGVNFQASLLGDFSFALWDSRNCRLIAATDQFAVRRVHYAMIPGGILVGNWAPLLYAHPALDRSLDDAAIVDFLVDGEMRPGETAFAAIRVLRPAHQLLWEDGRRSTTRYWSLPVEPLLDVRDAAEFPREFLRLARVAVADRVRGESVGVLMSGGVDSPGVAALAREITPADSVHLGTVTYESLFACDERIYAAAVGRHLGLHVDFFPSDSLRPFEDVTEWFDGEPIPVNDPFPAIEGRAVRAMSAQARVLFTGHATDAILAPQPLLQELTRGGPGGAVRTAASALSHVARYRRRPPTMLRYSRRRVVMGRRGELPAWLNNGSINNLRRPGEVVDEWTDHPRDRSFRKVMSPSLSAVLGSYVTFGRKFGMSCAHPFMDLRVVAFSLRVPPVPWCWDKHLVREAFRGLLPETVRVRPKTPIRANRLALSLKHFGYTHFANLRPGGSTSRFYVWRDFERLPDLMQRDPAWVHSRPIMLELFFRGWEDAFPRV